MLEKFWNLKIVVTLRELKGWFQRFAWKLERKEPKVGSESEADSPG